MNFEHLDDTSPVEPDESMRSAVVQRARRLRQRRAIVPGAALVVIVAVATLAVATFSNESSVPSRVVAGPSTTTTTSVVAHPTGAAVTRGAIHVEASIPDAVVAPGSHVRVSITVESLHAPAHIQLQMQVCIVDPPLGKGWTGFEPGASCPASTLTLPSTHVVDLIAPDRSGEYGVFLRWSPAPSGDFLPIPLRVVDNVSAETVTAHLQLATTSVVAGGALHGNLVIENTTGESIEIKDRCTPKWTVVLTRPGEDANAAFTLECGAAPFVVPAGTTLLPFTAPATERACTAGPNPDRETPECLPGNRIPPLPAGRYEAQLDSLGSMAPLPTPASVAVTVTAR